MSPNTSSEVQSNKKFKFKNSDSSESCSCDERSSNNSLLFNIQETSLDELDSSVTHSSKKNNWLNNHLMDTDDAKSTVSSIDYPVIDADYTIFREELSMKIADESFAVSTENEFSDSEDLLDFATMQSEMQSNISTEKICENFIQEFIEDVLNDIILSIILGIEEPDHNSHESLDENITSIIDDIISSIILEEISSNEDEIVRSTSEKIVEEIIDELISSIILQEISSEKIVEEIINELIQIGCLENDPVKNIIEEIFGESTIDVVLDLQKMVYDEVPDEIFMDYLVAEGSDNDNVEQMSVSGEDSQSR